MHSELERGTEQLQVLFRPQQHALHQAKQAPCKLRTGMVPFQGFYASMLGKFKQCPIAAFRAVLSEWR